MGSMRDPKRLPFRARPIRVRKGSIRDPTRVPCRDHPVRAPKTASILQGFLKRAPIRDLHGLPRGYAGS